MEWASKEMLKKIIKGTDVGNTIMAFEERHKEGINLNPLRANFFEKLLHQIEQSKTEWKAKEVRKHMIDNYKKTFWDEIGIRNMNL